MPKKLPRTRNNGTMTEAMFWSFIRSALRAKSMFWKPITQVKKDMRRPYTGPDKRRKFEYQCSSCKNWFADKEVEVDHKIPVGSLKSADDLKSFVTNLFCEVEGLTLLCKPCHLEKTHKKE